MGKHKKVKAPDARVNSRLGEAAGYVSRAMHRIFRPDTPESALDLFSRSVRERTTYHRKGDDAKRTSSYFPQIGKIKITRSARGYKAIVAIVHELTHALNLSGNQYLIATALHKYFTYLLEGNQFYYSDPKNFFHNKDNLKFLRSDLSMSSMDEHSKEYEATKDHPAFSGLGHSLATIMNSVDFIHHKPFAGLVALKEVLEKSNLTFKEVENEIIAGKHDAEIARVTKIIEEEFSKIPAEFFKAPKN